MNELRIEHIDVTKIDPSPYQPRTWFNEEKIVELSENIKQNGLIHPICVREKAGRFELLAGERRVRSVKHLAHDTIRSEIRDVTDEEARGIVLSENIQREDLTAIEQIASFAEWIDYQLNQHEDYQTLFIPNKFSFKCPHLPEHLHKLAFLLMKLDSDRRNNTDQFTNKFIGKIEEAFLSLPVKKDWLGFYVNELKPYSNMDEEVKVYAIQHKLNKSQAKTVAKVKKEAPTVFEEIKHGVMNVVNDDFRTEQVSIQEVSSRELNERVKQVNFENRLKDSRQSELMKPKFDRLRELEDQGVYIGSVWSFGPRENYAGRNDYHGNCIPQICENALLLFSQEGETVLDPMAGSGTTVDVCKAIKRECIAFDIQPENLRDGVQTGDARHLPTGNEYVDCVFWHPPYWNMVKYSSHDGELSNTTWEEFLTLSQEVLTELYRVLKPGKKLIILSGDKVQGGEFYPVTRKLSNIAEDIGFIDSGVAIKTTVNSTSQIASGKTIWAAIAYTNNIKVEHDFITVWRKRDETKPE